ncbi:hypothetical protein J4211_05925 [Candidatus Woesearchaeota archaeon]|nr:hypothetical protein [Candidatus Woesearchaeota archaeon]
MGKQRDVTLKGLDLKFGDGNWMIGWVAGIGLKWREENKLLEGRYVVFDFPRACRLYEDAYYEHFKQQQDELEWIIAHASEVFDNAETNIASGLDYLKQEESSTHIQDIAIRNVMARFGRQFEGKELLQIRIDCVGEKWNPANILFHKPEWFVEPRNVADATGKERWWVRERYRAREKSVECWWQSNKFVLVRR